VAEIEGELRALSLFRRSIRYMHAITLFWVAIISIRVSFFYLLLFNYMEGLIPQLQFYSLAYGVALEREL